MSWLMSLVLAALAATVAVMTFQALRSGEVRWRSGSVAAARLTNPGLYWAIILLQAVACIAIVSAIIS